MKKSLSLAVPLAGLIVILCIAYGLDSWIEMLKRDSFQNFSGTSSWLLPANIAQLFLAFLLLTFLWLIYNKINLNRAVALVYTLVGLGSVFYSAMAILLATIIPLPLLEPLFPKSMTSFTSAIIGVVGLQQLFKR